MKLACEMKGRNHRCDVLNYFDTALHPWRNHSHPPVTTLLMLRVNAFDHATLICCNLNCDIIGNAELSYFNQYVITKQCSKLWVKSPQHLPQAVFFRHTNVNTMGTWNNWMVFKDAVWLSALGRVYCYHDVDSLI